MKTATKTEGAALTGPRPNLWFTESALEHALQKLDERDPDGNLDVAGAESILKRYVDLKGAIEKRDEVAQFLIEARSLAAAKLAHADVLQKQAKGLLGGVESMEGAIVRLMKDVDTRALQGNLHVLKLKDSRGKVEVDDEAMIPEEFWRVKEDADLGRIRELADMVERFSRAAAIEDLRRELGGDSEPTAELVETWMAEDTDRMRANALLAEAVQVRRAVDKNAIQAEWKAHGETIEQSNAETGEITERPLVPGVRKDVTTTLVIE